jgi:hypothetical protein
LFYDISTKLTNVKNLAFANQIDLFGKIDINGKSKLVQFLEEAFVNRIKNSNIEVLS